MPQKQGVLPAKSKRGIPINPQRLVSGVSNTHKCACALCVFCTLAATEHGRARWEYLCLEQFAAPMISHACAWFLVCPSWGRRVSQTLLQIQQPNLILDFGVVTTERRIAPGNDCSIGQDRSKRSASGLNLLDTPQLTPSEVSPWHNCSTRTHCSERTGGWLHLMDMSESIPDRWAISTKCWIAPCDDGSVSQDRSKCTMGSLHVSNPPELLLNYAAITTIIWITPWIHLQEWWNVAVEHPWVPRASETIQSDRKGNRPRSQQIHRSGSRQKRQPRPEANGRSWAGRGCASCRHLDAGRPR